MTKSARSRPRRNARVRCAIYTRKSSEEGLDQEFNSLQAQREACEAFIHSQPVIRAWRTSERERRYASSPRWS